MAAEQPVFTEGNLMRHVTVMSLSSSMGIMAIYLVDLCDIFFISLLGEKQMAAAAGFASTVMFFVSAINIGVSVAAGTLVAAAMGAGDAQRARDVATSAAAFAMAVGVVLPAVMLIYVDPLLTFIGATGEVAEMAKSYLWIVLPSSLLSGLSMVAVSSLRADGQAKWSMYPSLAGALVNLIMDPILIFGLGFDLEGAAMATVLARIATLAVALHAATRMRSLFGAPSAAAMKHHLRPILLYTTPAIIASLAKPVGMAILVRYMSKFGADAVAAMAVLSRIYPVVFSVVNALSGSMGPIIGQNFGAGKIDRVREGFVDALKFLAAYVLIVAMILFVVRDQIAAAFSLSGQAQDLLFLGCGPLAVVAFFNGSIFIANAVFTNTGRPRVPVYLSWGRSTLGIVPFAHVGAMYLGAGGVLVGATVGGAAFSALAIYLGFRSINRSAVAQATVFQRKDLSTTHELVHRSGAWDG